MKAIILDPIGDVLLWILLAGFAVVVFVLQLFPIPVIAYASAVVFLSSAFAIIHANKYRQ